MHTGGGDFEIAIFARSDLCDFIFYRVMLHTVVLHLSQIFSKLQFFCIWTDTDVETGYIRSTPPS